MCVIMLVNSVRPTQEMVEKAWKANDHGAGIAWRERNKKGESEVVWRKGIMELEEIVDLCAKVPMPYVAHFRIASVGGVKKELTHPFLISAQVPNLLEGRTKGFLLFHNGHWGVWHERAMEAAIRSNSQVPDGAWSDSRAMAWMSHIYGRGFMEFLPTQKGIIMGPASTNILTGDGWVKINDVWCSNDYFWKRVRVANTRKYCTTRACNNYAQEGKELCWFCESDKKKAAASSTGANNSTAGGTTNNGSRPFLLEEGYLRMLDAESLYRKGEMSKTLVKKFKKAYHTIAVGSPKAVEKAKKDLREHTAVVLARVSVGRLQ